MHWGNEYEHNPTKRQEELALFLAEHKVDLVIGHHPHVVQPVRLIERKDGGSTLVYFSLGNFISAQKQNYTLLGGMALVRIVKDGEKITLEEAEYRLNRRCMKADLS
ncbi:hypothetical protein AGMMS50212_16090 [Spirochaetia bacterium]|nr:hypothetical protein AGMMS50212_16090 [Spirochaetia bacterium]